MLRFKGLPATYGFKPTLCVNQRNHKPIYFKHIKISGTHDDIIATAYINPAGQDNAQALEIAWQMDASKYSGIVEEDIPLDLIMEMVRDGVIEWNV